MITGVGFGILLIAAIGNVTTGGFVGLTAANANGNVEGLAALIFSRYLWAFELTSALLITAAVGAMVLAHRERFERRKTQRELSAGALPARRAPDPDAQPGRLRAPQRGRRGRVAARRLVLGLVGVADPANPRRGRQRDLPARLRPSPIKGGAS